MRDLVVALGLVLVIEGAIHALIPERAQAYMRLAAGLRPQVLRQAGILAVIAGFVIVWLARGG
jgi:uncharacterized protein YjeT (DUF2065 family)